MGTYLVVQWLKFHTANVGGKGLLPGWGTKIPQSAWHGQKIHSFIYLFLTVLGLHCCAGFSFVSASRGYSLVVHWLLIVVASLVVEHICCGALASLISAQSSREGSATTHGFRSCGSWALAHRLSSCGASA